MSERTTTNNNNTKESTENNNNNNKNNNNWLQKTSPKKIDNGRCRSSICKCTQCTMYIRSFCIL